MFIQDFCMSAFVQEVAAGRDYRPTGKHWNSEPDTNWLFSALAPLATRRNVAARRALFAAGNPALGFYLVVSGKLMVHRRIAGATSGQPRTVVRSAERGDLLIYDCDGTHVADCDALEDSVVLWIDRRRFERQAALDPVLQRAGNAVHASELEWILHSLGPGRGCARHEKLHTMFGNAPRWGQRQLVSTAPQRGGAVLLS